MIVFWGIILGLALADFGFLAMRDPMKWSLFLPRLKGNYQRLVLDRAQRIQLRLYGASLLLVGLVIATAALKRVLKIQAMDAISIGLLVLMSILFFGVCIFGSAFFVVQLIRGRSMYWLGFWKRGEALEPVPISLPMTSAMQKEAETFTFGFCLLVTVTICVALYYR